MQSLEREVRRLRLQTTLSMLVCGASLLSSFAPSDKKAFEEIDVQRINVVEKDGRLCMVISNEARQHPGIADGKLIERNGPRPPGILFFDQRGDEMGGLIFGENGETGHFGSLTFDKVRGDQTLGFRHLEGDDGHYATGIEMWHQPNIPLQQMLAQLEEARALKGTEREAALARLRERNELTTRRLFLGKERDDTSRLELFDVQGRPRVRLVVPADGAAVMDFLDEKGEVVLELP